MFWFPTCLRCTSYSQASLCHYTIGTVSIRAQLTFKPLLYFLGGYSPSKTIHQILSQYVFAVLVRTCLQKEWYFTDEQNPSENESIRPLPSMLRSLKTCSISSYSKASRVFSSNCTYPASSPGLYFHRAGPRDSFPLITPFVRVGTYPTRYFATLGPLQLRPTFTRAYIDHHIILRPHNVNI